MSSLSIVWISWKPNYLNKDSVRVKFVCYNPKFRRVATLPTFKLYKIFHTELITFLPTKFHMPIYSRFSVTAIYQNIQTTFTLLSVTYSDVSRFFEARSEITNLKKKSQLSITLLFIWLNDLNFAESTKSFFPPYLKHSFAIYFSAKFVSVAFVFLTRWYLMFRLTFTQIWF